MREREMLPMYPQPVSSVWNQPLVIHSHIAPAESADPQLVDYSLTPEAANCWIGPLSLWLFHITRGNATMILSACAGRSLHAHGAEGWADLQVGSEKSLP